MEKLYNLVLDNIYLFCLFMIIIFIIIILVLCLMKNSKNKRLEQEEEVIDDTIKSKEDLESITDEEIEKRVLEQYTKENEETEEEYTSSIEGIIDQLKTASAPTPSEALKKFEEEQEEQAIISYQQLVESVKNNKIEIKDDEDEYKNDNVKTTSDVLAKIEVLNSEIEEEVINKEFEVEKKDYSYKPNEFISPVFGRMDSSNVLYRQGLEYTDKKSKVDYNKETEILLSDVLEPKKEEVKKERDIFIPQKKLDAEEFLKNLKDFREKL